MIEITEQSRWFKLLKNQYLNIRAKNYVFKLHILIYRFVTLISYNFETSFPIEICRYLPPNFINSFLRKVLNIYFLVIVIVFIIKVIEDGGSK